METPQSFGPQCRAPVILPSIGGDDEEDHYDDDPCGDDEDHYDEDHYDEDHYDDIWFPQRTKTGEIVRFFCSRLPVELCSVRGKPVLQSRLHPGDYHHGFDDAFDDDGAFDGAFDDAADFDDGFDSAADFDDDDDDNGSHPFDNHQIRPARGNGDAFKDS